MNTVVAVCALLLFVTCVTLMFHPLLKHLALSEVPAAVLVCLCGRRYRRTLAGILVRRRLAASVPVPLRPEKTRMPGPVTASLLVRRPGIPTPRLDAYRAASAYCQREPEPFRGVPHSCSRCEEDRRDFQ